ncbi:MAG: hypothetical protein M3436_20390, partial [Pseudomonadota bacterium]|nr:hypothetical protein [Pseudomonadota bacterium]
MKSRPFLTFGFRLLTLLLLLFSSLPAAAQDGHWTLEAVLSWEGNADYGLTLSTPSGYVDPDESSEGFTHGGDVNCATGGIGPETISGTGGGQGGYHFEGFWWRNCPGGIRPSGVALTAKITAHRRLTINGQSFAPGAVFERTVYPDDAGDLIIDVRIQFARGELAVDANRDGVVSFDQDNTTEQQAHRFWVNNDHDTKDGDGEGEELSGDEDSADNRIQSRRDLEDFARLDIFIGDLHEAIVNGQRKVGLKWKNTNGTAPSMKVWRNLSPGGGSEYLTDDAVAAQHVSQLINPGHVQGTETYVIPQQFWQDAGLSASQPKGHLLFEGVTEGTGQLTLVFQDAQGQEIGEEPGPWLNLKNIRKMYQRGKAQPEDIDAPNGNIVGPFTGPMSYVDDPWNWPFEADPNEENKAVIFVHGWSMDYPNYLNFSETMFKRLWHQGFKGRFCSFRWDTLVVSQVWDIDVSAGEYNRSEHRAWLYGESLRQFGDAIKGDGFTVSLIGHSMGNVVCGSSLQVGLGVQHYVLMEAAVPAGSFDTSGDNGAGGVNDYARFWNAEVGE